MNEFDLFQSALELEDPAARKAFLMSACEHDAALLNRVEALLASHHEQSQFLNTPVVEQITELSQAPNMVNALPVLAALGEMNPTVKTVDICQI